MNAKHFLLALATAVALPAIPPAMAHEFNAGTITIGHPYIVATPATAKTGAGYFTVTNTGTEPDTLVEVTSDPAGSLHNTTTDASGVTRMTEVEALEIPPGQTVTLKPRGMHVMFMGLTKPFLVGEEVAATLVFEKAGPVNVTFNVQSRAESASDPASATPEAAPEGGMSHEGMPGMTN